MRVGARGALAVAPMPGTFPPVSLLQRGAVMARRLLSWLLRQDLFVIASVGALAALTWAFAEIADAVREEETRSVDESVLRALRSDPAGLDPIGPDWVTRAMVDLSALGSPAVTTLIVIVVAGFLLLGKKPRLALLVIASALATTGSMLALKELFERGRPAIVARVVEENGLSFPSGHAAVSAALYTTIGVLLARTVPGTRLRVYVVLVSVVVALLIGATRVYLGVHYPTDVVAGWTLGAAVALTCGVAARALERRGLVESGPNDPRAPFTSSEPRAQPPSAPPGSSPTR